MTIEEKKLLRKIIASKKKLFSARELVLKSISILNKLEKHPVFQEAEVVLLYHSLPDEVNTHDFIIKWRNKKTILLPVVKGDTLVLRTYTGEQNLKKGSYGINEPTGDIFTDYQSIDLVIVPGVSFDTKGNRLGRGKGYYDGLLPQLTTAYKIGVCFTFQISESIPYESHDIEMDSVLSEEGILTGI